MDVISNFAARFERTREEELSLEDYLAECKRNPLAYATAAERMLKAIGEPQMVDTRNDPRLSRIFANKVIKIYPAFAEFYGMEDAIEQVVSLLPPRRAGPGREEADPLPAGPGGRRQELDRRAPEAADGARAVLRDQGLAGQRVAARPVRRGRRRPDPREGIRHPAPLPATASCRPWAVKRLDEYGGDIRKFKVVKRYPSILKQIGDQQDRAGRREQPGHLARWSARSTSASSRPTRRTTPTPTATPAACAWPTRACSSSSRCSRRRSRCCTRC